VEEIHKLFVISLKLFPLFPLKCLAKYFEKLFIKADPDIG
jgi:hypothetical protein